jgi:hypothetical protein
MFEGYRVVVVCPAGRRHLADLMRRHVERARPLVDEMHWWLNTDNPDDAGYMHELARVAPWFHRVVMVPGPNRFFRRHMGIGRFFRRATDRDTIYVRVDDDVVWMIDGGLEALVRHRVNHPDAYLVYGNIVNSSRFMHLHQKGGGFDPGFEVSYALNHETNRHSSEAGLAAHAAILATAEALAAGGDREALLAPWAGFGRHVFAPGEHNDVNMICWFGRDFAAWRGTCPPAIHEEEWICLRMPSVHGGRVHEACGDALCAHYASVYQYDAIAARPEILDRYARLAPPSEIARWSESAGVEVMA